MRDANLVLQLQLQLEQFEVIAVFSGYLVSISSYGGAAEIIHFA